MSGEGHIPLLVVFKEYSSGERVALDIIGLRKVEDFKAPDEIDAHEIIPGELQPKITGKKPNPNYHEMGAKLVFTKKSGKPPVTVREDMETVMAKIAKERLEFEMAMEARRITGTSPHSQDCRYYPPRITETPAELAARLARRQRGGQQHVFH